MQNSVWQGMHYPWWAAPCVQAAACIPAACMYMHPKYGNRISHPSSSAHPPAPRQQRLVPHIAALRRPHRVSSPPSSPLTAWTPLPAVPQQQLLHCVTPTAWICFPMHALYSMDTIPHACPPTAWIILPCTLSGHTCPPPHLSPQKRLLHTVLPGCFLLSGVLPVGQGQAERHACVRV